ncbi:MAG: hypothetical protein ACR2NP_05630 [Pirellulaceae bacterium]
MYLKIATTAMLLAALISAPVLAQKGSAPNPPDESSTPASTELTGVRVDISKTGIERPLERIVEYSPLIVFQPPNGPRPPVDDQSKRFIESSLEELVDQARSPAPVDSLVTDDNPSCEPGLIEWHESFAEACAASRESGKPVLLFQLLGRLDERFT